MKWPDGAEYAFTFSFHLDGETLWTSRDPAYQRRSSALSQGRFGPKVGADLILRLLDRHGMTATWFIPGLVAETYPTLVRRIAEAGHEIAHHGYAHEHTDPDDPEGEEAILVRAFEALESVAGVRPVGYCAPSWEFNAGTVPMLQKHGFRYSTNMMDDISPYLHVVDGEPVPLVELPIHWLLDDAPYRLFSPQQPRTLRSARELASMWTEEIQGIATYGGVANLVLHPQVVGRPSLLAEFDQLLTAIRQDEHAYVDRNDRVAEWSLRQLQAPPGVS